MPRTLKKPSKIGSIKEEIIKMIQRLPKDCTLDDIQYHLYVRQMVEHGIADIEAGRVIPHEEAVQRMKKWLKSRGLGGR